MGAVKVPESNPTPQVRSDGRMFVTTRWSVVLRAGGASPPHRSGFSLGNAAVCDLFLPDGEGVLLVRTNGLVDRMVAPDFKTIPVPAFGTGVAVVTRIPGSGQFVITGRSGVVSLHTADTFDETGRFAGTTNVPTAFSCWVPSAEVLGLRTSDDQLEAWDVRSHQRSWQVPLLPGRELSDAKPEGVLWPVHVDGWVVGYGGGWEPVPSSVSQTLRLCTVA